MDRKDFLPHRPMTPQDIIDTSFVPDTNKVFVLGCFESRVTVYSQQVRALNLVDAILDRGLIRDNGKVAIIGGGAAGITAAAAFAKAAPHLQAIDVYEARSDVLELQRQSTRYLHPHLYDWPNPGSDAEEAGLPILNWRAGLAGEVSTVLRRQFDEVMRTSVLRLDVGSRITGLTLLGLGRSPSDTSGRFCAGQDL